MIKNIIFDLGNVIIEATKEIMCSAYTSNKEEQKFIKEEILDGEIWPLLDLGMISIEEAIKRVNEKTNGIYAELTKNFLNEYFKYLKINKDTVEIAKRLKDEGYNIYVLSNMSTNAYEYFYENNQDFFSICSGIIVSGYEKIKKPDERIFKILLDRYNLNPEECLFIDDDDTGRSLTMANSLKISGRRVLQNDAKDVEKLLKEYNIIGEEDMVNLDEAKNEFFNYVKNYDENEPNINRKIHHSIRVMEISKIIAEKECKNNEEIEIATLIGLLHDIARFEQFTIYKTFSDVQSVDHGDFGVQILKSEDYLRKYIKQRNYDEIILKAIKNHNKYMIENNITETEEMFCKIIRDADKVDIFYEATEMFWDDKEKEIEESQISENVYGVIKSNKILKREKNVRLYGIDDVCSLLAMIFDINYEISLKIIRDNDYINKIINRFDFKDENTKIKMEEIRAICNNYIINKIQ